MMKKLLLGVASSFLLMGAAQAETILVNDGGDFDGAGAIGSNPAPQFSNPGFFGGAIGGTDVASPNNSVAHRFTGIMSGASSAILTIQVNQFFGGSNNDRILAGDAASGTNAGNSLSNLNSFAVTMGNTITIDLIAAGLLGILNTGQLDVLITDDRNIDFLQLDVTASAIPVPAALPLMASALIGGAAAMRRRKKAA